jgi:hypothetical protein
MEDAMKPMPPQGQPEPLQWDPPLERTVATPANLRAASGLMSGTLEVPPNVRDHYIADRFPGLMECGEDLQEVARVIGGARLYFDEGKTDRALELLDLAIEQSPFDEPLRLARLEIAFLLRDGPLYTAIATEFHRVCGASPAWREVSRLGRAVAPLEKLFGARQGERAHEHYGPWPDTPNWINASWDLTPEVLAVDYHRLMARTAPLPLDPGTPDSRKR